MDELAYGTKKEIEEHLKAYEWLQKYVQIENRFPPPKVFFGKIAQAHIDEDHEYYSKELAREQEAYAARELAKEKVALKEAASTKDMIEYAKALEESFERTHKLAYGKLIQSN